MRNTRSIMRFLLTLLGYLAATILFQYLVSRVIEGGAPTGKGLPMGRILTGLLNAGLVQCFLIILIATGLTCGKKKGALLLSGCLLIINQLLNSAEALLFLRNIYPPKEQLANLLSGTLASLTLGILGAALWVGEKDSRGPQRQLRVSKGLILSWIGWTILWFVIYFTAGLLIPMNEAGVREYYFAGAGAMNPSLLPWAYLMQIPRAALWIIMGTGLYFNLRGSPREKRLLIGLFFGGVMAAGLLVPNHIMPDFVRLAHFPEIFLANLLWGYLLSMGIGKRLLGEG